MIRYFSLLHVPQRGEPRESSISRRAQPSKKKSRHAPSRRNEVRAVPYVFFMAAMALVLSHSSSANTLLRDGMSRIIYWEPSSANVQSPSRDLRGRTSGHETLNEHTEASSSGETMTRTQDVPEPASHYSPYKDEMESVESLSMSVSQKKSAKAISRLSNPNDPAQISETQEATANQYDARSAYSRSEYESKDMQNTNPSPAPASGKTQTIYGKPTEGPSEEGHSNQRHEDGPRHDVNFQNEDAQKVTDLDLLDPEEGGFELDIRIEGREALLSGPDRREIARDVRSNSQQTTATNEDSQPEQDAVERTDEDSSDDNRSPKSDSARAEKESELSQAKESGSDVSTEDENGDEQTRANSEPPRDRALEGGSEGAVRSDGDGSA